MKMRVSALLAAVLVAVPLLAQEKPKPAAPAAPPAETKKESKMVTTPSGLMYEDLKVGTGASPQPGQTCVMHYSGWLWVNAAKGSKFDSSVDRGKPFPFPIGAGRVIKGWDEGVATMKVGGRRILIIPPDLAYGAPGRPPVIPPNSTLCFEVELLEVK